MNQPDMGSSSVSMKKTPFGYIINYYGVDSNVTFPSFEEANKVYVAILEEHNLLFQDLRDVAVQGWQVYASVSGATLTKFGVLLHRASTKEVKMATRIYNMLALEIPEEWSAILSEVEGNPAQGTTG